MSTIVEARGLKMYFPVGRTLGGKPKRLPKTELSDTHYTYCWLRQKEEFEKGGKA